MRYIWTISKYFHYPYEWMFGGGESYIIAEITGNWIINLTSAVELLQLKAYWWTEQRNLPSEYTQVEYIESSGTQYIDTGITDITNSEFEVVAQQTSIAGQFPTIMWALDNSDYKVICGLSTSNNTFYSQCGDWQGFIVSSVPNDTEKHTFKVITTTNKQTLQVDNTETVTGNYRITSTTDCSLTICARNKVPVSNFTKQKVFSVYIKKSGILIQGLIPAKRNSDNVLGMYDTVSWKFLTNSGTWTFTAWSEVVPTPANPMNIVSNNWVLKVSKNLFDYRYFYDNYQEYTTSAVGRCPIKLKPNTAYTVSTNKNSSVGNSVIFVVSWNAIDWTPNTANNGVLVESPRTITTDSNGYLCLGIYVKSDSAVPESDFENGTVWVQIERGTTATTYMPYGQIYTDWTTETIEIHGKNLFNPATRTNGYYIGADGTIAQGSGTFCYSALIPVKPNTDYMLSGIAGQSDIRRLHAYDSNGNWISQISFANTSTGNTYNITGITPNNCAYIRISIPKLDTNVQVEQGATTTEYEAYFDGWTATAEMLLKVWDYIDEQSILDGAITRNVGIKILDGTEDWTKSGVGTAQDPIRFAVAGFITFPDSDTIECLNTHYPFSGVASTGWSITPGTFNVGIYNNIHYIRFAPTNITELAQWKQYITDQYNVWTPIIIVYPLATATTESVEGQALNIQKGNNTIEITQASIDNLPLYAKYKATSE